MLTPLSPLRAVTTHRLLPAAATLLSLQESSLESSLVAWSLLLRAPSLSCFANANCETTRNAALMLHQKLWLAVRPTREYN